MRANISVGVTHTLWTKETLAERVSQTLQRRYVDSRSAVKDLARKLDISLSGAEKLLSGERSPTGVHLMNMDLQFGASLIEEIKGCPDKNREEVLTLLKQLEDKWARW